MKVAFLTTHPIQYQVPVFRALSGEPDIDLTVLFAMIPDAAQQGAGFGVAFEWDLPLLDGYAHRTLQNVARDPSVTRFAGCDCPDIGTALDELQTDVLVINGWNAKSCLQGLWAAKRRGLRTVVRGEANDLRERAWWKRRLQSHLVRRFDAAGFIGEANRRFYLDRGLRGSQLFPARYCIENDRFARAIDDGERERVRRQRGIPDDAVCFLFSGKLEPKKHPAKMIAAFRRAAAVAEAEGRRLHLLLVGDGPLRAECEAAAGGCEAISFAGFVNQTQIPGLYAASDCLILPSDAGETWGLVVNEAMACGRPAIVSDLAGCHLDLITPSQTGWTFPFGDWDALADRIAAAAAADLPAVGRAARERIADYSPERAAAGLAESIRAVAGTGRRVSAAEPVPAGGGHG